MLFRSGQDRSRDIIEPTGGDNELWSFGERNFEILKELVLLRDQLRPYTRKSMDAASQAGVPVMRPMFFDYPEDEVCYTLGEQYMFGDDILFAPITQRGQTEKRVYLPKGEWIFVRDNTEYKGGAWYEIKAELHEFIAFAKKGSDVIKCFSKS